MVVNKRISIDTKGFTDIVDITDKIAQEVDSTGIVNGTVTVFAAGSTAGITTIEYEEGLINDVKKMWERLIQHGLPYDHNERWGDGNGYAHVRAALLGPSMVIPLVNKKLALGTWQQVVVIDFDNRPRRREIVIQVMGE